MDNNQNKVDVVLATNMSNIVGSLELRIAQLQVENQKLQLRNSELETQNNNLRKQKGGGSGESIHHNSANK